MRVIIHPHHVERGCLNPEYNRTVGDEKITIRYLPHVHAISTVKRNRLVKRKEPPQSTREAEAEREDQYQHEPNAGFPIPVAACQIGRSLVPTG